VFTSRKLRKFGTFLRFVARPRKGAFIFDSSKRLSPHSILLPIFEPFADGKGRETGTCSSAGKKPGASNRGSQMARFELADVDGATLAPVNASGEVFYELGMMYAAGRTVTPDLIVAHKWFNLAAMRGNPDAVRLRREISEEMSAAEIAAAQRAARDWLTTH
jgi:hypothetical protein